MVQYINDPSSLSNTYYNGCGTKQVPCTTPLKIVTSGVTYDGTNYPDYNIYKQQNLNQVLANIISNLGSGGSGIVQVYTEDSDTISFTGIGTQANPLVATATIDVSTPGLQAVTDVSSLTSNAISIQGSNNYPSGEGMYLSYSSGQGNIVVQDATGNQITSPLYVLASGISLYTNGGDLAIVSGTGHFNFSGAMVFTSNLSTPAVFQTNSSVKLRVKGAAATESDDFVTYSQISGIVGTSYTFSNTGFSI